MKKDAAEQRTQLTEQRLKVDFDTYDVTVDELIRRTERGRIDVAPVYQRQFRWGSQRQSCLIESLFLGIPVPPLFMATNNIAGAGAQWEVVDGLQRLLTMVNFAGNLAARSKVGLKGESLSLEKVEKLTNLIGCTFESLPADIRSTFEDRPVKVVVLNDKSDLAVRYDLFERLNTGGLALTAQEVRECIFRGPFMGLLGELSETKTFKQVVVLPDNSWRDGTPQDYALRFFAFYERYKTFDHSVKDFLYQYTKDTTESHDIASLRSRFTRTFEFLAKVFPTGVKTRKGITPRQSLRSSLGGRGFGPKKEP